MLDGGANAGFASAGERAMRCCAARDARVTSCDSSYLICRRVDETLSDRRSSTPAWRASICPDSAQADAREAESTVSVQCKRASFVSWTDR